MRSSLRAWGFDVVAAVSGKNYGLGRSRFAAREGGGDQSTPQCECVRLHRSLIRPDVAGIGRTRHSVSQGASSTTSSGQPMRKLGLRMTDHFNADLRSVPILSPISVKLKVENYARARDGGTREQS